MSYHSATLIDQCWTNNTEALIKSGIVQEDVSDHYLLFSNFALQSESIVSEDHAVFQRRKLTEHAHTRMFTELAATDWNECYDIDANLYFDEFFDKFLRIYDDCFSVRC